MTSDEFLDKWLQLSYNRLQNQGKKVMYKTDKRRDSDVYGRNGKGHHALFVLVTNIL
jgi:hypothetical protein